MECPYCRADSRVLDSRLSGDDVRRRRECSACRRRFTTYERLEPPEIRVAKRGERGTEDFDRDKLLHAALRVARDRPITPATCDALVRRIEAELVDSGAHLIASGQLAARLHAQLLELDPVAAARFASNYPQDTLRVAADHAPNQLLLPHLSAPPPEMDKPVTRRRSKPK